jgi:hypothetical protein
MSYFNSHINKLQVRSSRMEHTIPTNGTRTAMMNQPARREAELNPHREMVRAQTRVRGQIRNPSPLAATDQLPRKITDNRKPTGPHMNKATMTTSMSSNMVLPSTLVDVKPIISPGKRYRIHTMACTMAWRPQPTHCASSSRLGGYTVESDPSLGSSRPPVERGLRQQTCPYGHGVGGSRIWRDL